MDRVSQVAEAAMAADRIRSLMGHRAEYSVRQEQILDSLESIFLVRGFGALTVSELAKEAQCSRRTLYTLAATKEELVLLVLDRMWRRLGDRGRQAMSQARTPAAQIEAFLYEVVAIYRAPWQGLIADIIAYGPARRLFNDHIGVGVDFLTSLVAAGVREGQFRPVNPRLAAEILSAATSQMVGREALVDETFDSGTAIREAIRIVLYGLMVSQPGRRAKSR